MIFICVSPDIAKSSLAKKKINQKKQPTKQIKHAAYNTD